MPKKKRGRADPLTEPALRRRAERARRAGDEAGLARALTTLSRLKRLAALGPPAEAEPTGEAQFEAMSDEEFYAKLALLSDGLAGTREADRSGLDSDFCS